MSDSPTKPTFYVSFGLGNVHRNSYAKVLASSRDVVLQYCNKGFFPGYCEIYSEAKWNTFHWVKDMTQIPCVEELP